MGLTKPKGLALLTVLVGATLGGQFGHSAEPRTISKWSYGGEPWEARQFTPDEQKRLTVEWAEPKVEQEPSPLPKHVPQFIISGKLLIESEDEKERRPVDWYQPITVVLSRTHLDRPDWSNGYSEEDSVWNGGVVNRGLRSEQSQTKPKKNGSFKVAFRLSELRRPVGATKAFQVGLVIEDRDLTNAGRVLRQSIKHINITGPRKLSRTLRLINGTPSPIGCGHNPVALIQAVNHLRSLGKEEAIKALREYLEIAYDAGHYYYFDPVYPESSDTSNRWRLATLIPLVFEPEKTGEKLPAGGMEVFIERWKSVGDGRDVNFDDQEYVLAYEEWVWPNNYITVWRGITFHNRYVGGYTGWPESTAYLVEWADERGKIIEGRLRPMDDPFEAAEELYSRLADERRAGPEKALAELRLHLRLQTWRMIAHLVEPERKRPREMFDVSDQEWFKLKSKAAQLHIRWDEDRDEYTLN